jgi:hypothetical protein
VVDLGVLALSAFRNWRWFTLIALLSSLAAFGVWYNRFGDEASLLTSQGSLTLIFLIFIGATMLYHIVWRRAAQSFDYSLMVINAAAYFGISYGLLRPDLKEWMGGFTFVLALFYGGLAYVTLRRGTENRRLSFYALGIALIFLTIAIPIQLGDVALLTIAWAAEGAVLVWLSFTLRMSLFRIFSYAAFAAMAFRLLFFDAMLSLPDAQPFINERFLAFLIGIIATYLSSYLIWHNREFLLESEKTAWPVFPIFLVAASLLVTVSIAIELGNSVWTTIAWAAEGAVLVWLSFTLRMSLFRIFSYAVFAAMAFRLLFIDATLSLPDAQPFINERFLAFLVGITATYFAGYLIWRERKSLIEWEQGNWSVFPIFLVGASLLVTVSIYVELENNVWTTIAWAAEGAVLMWLSFTLRIPVFRSLSYIVFIAMAFRLLFFDTEVVLATFRPVLNERFIAFMAGIAALYYASWREMKALRESEVTSSYHLAFLVAAHFFTLWLLSAEIINYFDSRIVAIIGGGSGSDETALQNAKNLSLTGLWAFYAVVLLVIGIVKRSRFVRVVGLVLFVIPIIKVFAYDVFALEQVYRIIAFVGLGVLLITSGYLYQRYSKSIKGFFIDK